MAVYYINLLRRASRDTERDGPQKKSGEIALATISLWLRSGQSVIHETSGSKHFIMAFCVPTCELNESKLDDILTILIRAGGQPGQENSGKDRKYFELSPLWQWNGHRQRCLGIGSWSVGRNGQWRTADDRRFCHCSNDWTIESYYREATIPAGKLGSFFLYDWTGVLDRSRETQGSVTRVVPAALPA